MIEVTDEMVLKALSHADQMTNRIAISANAMRAALTAVAPLILENAALLVEAEAVTIGAQTGSSIWVALHGAAQAIRALASRPVSEREGAATAPAPAISGGEMVNVPRVATEAMIEAGWIDKEDVDPQDIWAAMVDAALAAADRSAS